MTLIHFMRISCKHYFELMTPAVKHAYGFSHTPYLWLVLTAHQRNTTAPKFPDMSNGISYIRVLYDSVLIVPKQKHCHYVGSHTFVAKGMYIFVHVVFKEKKCRPHPHENTLSFSELSTLETECQNKGKNYSNVAWVAWTYCNTRGSATYKTLPLVLCISFTHELSFKLHVFLSLPLPPLRVSLSTSSPWAPGQALPFIFPCKSNESHMQTRTFAFTHSHKLPST